MASKTKKTKMPTRKSLGLPSNVVRVVSLRKDGKRAKRVVVRCIDRQEGSDCTKTREVATQDVFQVRRCQNCQIVHLRALRRAANKAQRAI